MAKPHSTGRATGQQDYTGRRFGRLTVVREGERYPDGHRRWWCRCDCGTEKLISAGSLRKRVTVSCGCRMRSAGQGNATHGQAKPGRVTVEFMTWQKMIERCHNPRTKAYRYYGGRGIRVCDEWRRDFAAFFLHVGKRPSPAHSIDRKDNDGHYEPGNVRWATRKEQSRNRRGVRLLTHDGRTMHMVDWAIETGIDRRLLTARIDRLGWSVERALTTPVGGGCHA